MSCNFAIFRQKPKNITWKGNKLAYYTRRNQGQRGKVPQIGPDSNNWQSAKFWVFKFQISLARVSRPRPPRPARLNWFFFLGEKKFGFLANNATATVYSRFFFWRKFVKIKRFYFSYQRYYRGICCRRAGKCSFRRISLHIDLEIAGKSKNPPNFAKKLKNSCSYRTKQTSICFWQRFPVKSPLKTTRSHF